ncbi:MAG: SDR family oxidoreductase [Lachnospiraceae bacterium]|nr:SDR family oxidoreductase [Lachnospiraceae bacterium]
MNDFMSIFSLEGKVAVISGGAGRYGKQFVKGLAMAGAKVYMASRNMLANETAAKELREQGLKVYAAYLDLEDESSILALRDYVYSQESKVDILVNNSVARTMNGYSDTKERFDKSMTINATGLFLITRAFGNRMCQSGNGSIINIGSYMGILGPNYSLYEGTDMCKNGASPDYFFHKGGMTNYTRYIASHYGKHGVRCNVLELGGLYNDQPEAFVKHYSDSTCLGRMASDTDVLGSVIFLASDASAYITGAVIPVDGGYTAK